MKPGRPERTATALKEQLGLKVEATKATVDVIVIDSVQKVAAATQYRNNTVLVTMKVLEAAGLLTLTLPDTIDSHDPVPQLDDHV